MDYFDTKSEYLTPQEEGEILSRFRCENYEYNPTKVTYQMYDGALLPGTPALLGNAIVGIRTDAHNPGVILIDLEWRSYTDPHIEYVCKRLAEFDRNVERHPEKDWIFYMNITKVESKGEKDRVLTAHVVNPFMWSLSRKNPGELAPDFEAGGELVGGSVLRLAVFADNFEIEESDEADFSKLKGEILREYESENFV